MKILATCLTLWMILANGGPIQVGIGGDWVVYLEMRGGQEYDHELALEQDGSKLKGYWRAATPSAKKLKVSGEVDDSSIEFTVSSAEKDLLRFQGTIADSQTRMKGQCEVVESGGLLKWRGIRADAHEPR